MNRCAKSRAGILPARRALQRSRAYGAELYASAHADHQDRRHAGERRGRRSQRPGRARSPSQYGCADKGGAGEALLPLPLEPR